MSRSIDALLAERRRLVDDALAATLPRLPRWAFLSLMRASLPVRGRR